MTTVKTTLQSVSASSSPEVQMNDNFIALAALALFAMRAPATSGLTWGYFGGIFNTNNIDDGTVALTDSATNYVVVHRVTGVVSAATTTTNWLDGLYARLYKLTTSGGAVTATEDHRFDNSGLFGSSGIPMQSKSVAYAFTAADANIGVLHPSADTTGRTFTIPANSSVPYPVGTCLPIVNQHGAGNVTIAITTDTMRLAGAGSTGSRTLLADGIAFAIKVAATEWLVSGTNLS